MIYSTITGKYYDEKDSIRVINTAQVNFYWHSGVQPLAIYPSNDLKTGEPIIVYVFSKEKTKELYKKWLENRPKK